MLVKCKGTGTRDTFYCTLEISELNSYVAICLHRETMCPRAYCFLDLDLGSSETFVSTKVPAQLLHLQWARAASDN